MEQNELKIGISNWIIYTPSYNLSSRVLKNWNSYHYHSFTELLNGLLRVTTTLECITINDEVISWRNQLSREVVLRRYLKKNWDFFPIKGIN